MCPDKCQNMYNLEKMSLVDPREILSRNDSAAAGRGVALQSVLELISAEDWGGSRLVLITNVRCSQLVKVLL